MSFPPLAVLLEDNHLLALNKPAGLATMGTPGDQATLLTLAKDYVKQKYSKPGNVYLGVMSRLDAPVTGVVLLARTSKAAARLTEQFRSHTVEKTYWALVEGTVAAEADTYVDWLAEDPRHRRMHIVGRTLPGAKEARLSYRRLAVFAVPPSSRVGRAERAPPNEFHLGRVGLAPLDPPYNALSLLQIAPETGRKHQIRLQLAHHGHPVVGDRKYGSRLGFPQGIALHARRLVIAHPVGGEAVLLEAPLPKYWPAACGSGQGGVM